MTGAYRPSSGSDAIAGLVALSMYSMIVLISWFVSAGCGGISASPHTFELPIRTFNANAPIVVGSGRYFPDNMTNVGPADGVSRV